MESIAKGLCADIPSVVLTGIKTFAKMRLGKCDGDETAVTAQYVAHLQ